MAFGYTGDVFASFIALHSQSSTDLPYTSNISLPSKDYIMSEINWQVLVKEWCFFFPSCAMGSSLSHWVRRVSWFNESKKNVRVPLWGVVLLIGMGSWNEALRDVPVWVDRSSYRNLMRWNDQFEDKVFTNVKVNANCFSWFRPLVWSFLYTNNETILRRGSPNL